MLQWFQSVSGGAPRTTAAKPKAGTKVILVRLALLWTSLLLAAFAFTYLNSERRLLLKWLGGDSEGGTRANWFSLGWVGVLLLILAARTWRTLASPPLLVRAVLELASIAVGVVLAREFLRHNWWL